MGYQALITLVLVASAVVVSYARPNEEFNRNMTRERRNTEGDTFSLGYEVTARPSIDSKVEYTMVFRIPIPMTGHITATTFYVGDKDMVEAFRTLDTVPERVMYLGVYRRRGEGECHFTVMDRRRITGLPLEGPVTKTLNTPMYVEAGDHYGFSWDNRGVIPYDTLPVDQQELCDAEGIYAKDENVQLYADRSGNRVYSLQITFLPSGPMLLPPPVPETTVVPTIGEEADPPTTERKGVMSTIYQLQAHASEPPAEHDVLGRFTIATFPRPGPASAPAPPRVTSCARRCQLTAACVSFRWHGATGACQLLASSYRHDETSDGLEQDWAFYLWMSDV